MSVKIPIYTGACTCCPKYKQIKVIDKDFGTIEGYCETTRIKFITDEGTEYIPDWCPHKSKIDKLTFGQFIAIILLIIVIYLCITSTIYTLHL